MLSLLPRLFVVGQNQSSWLSLWQLESQAACVPSLVSRHCFSLAATHNNLRANNWRQTYSTASTWSVLTRFLDASNGVLDLSAYQNRPKHHHFLIPTTARMQVVGIKLSLIRDPCADCWNRCECLTGLTAVLCGFLALLLRRHCHPPTMMLANFAATPLELRSA